MINNLVHNWAVITRKFNQHAKKRSQIWLHWIRRLLYAEFIPHCDPTFVHRKHWERSMKKAKNINERRDVFIVIRFLVSLRCPKVIFDFIFFFFVSNNTIIVWFILRIYNFFNVLLCTFTHGVCSCSLYLRFMKPMKWMLFWCNLL